MAKLLGRDYCPMLEHRVLGATSGNLSFPEHCCTDDDFSQAGTGLTDIQDVVS